MRPSKNVIENTWLAYAFDRPAEAERIRAGIERVGGHYGAQLAAPPARRESIGGLHGMVLWEREDPRLRWPLFHEADGLAMAGPGLPTGWRRVIGACDLAAAPGRLAAKLHDDPAEARNLNPPALLGVRSAQEGRLQIVTDAVGAGRAYELRTGDGWVWSNRLGALPLFAGVEPAADLRAWQVFAAAGWFLGTDTPLEGARKLAPGSAVRIRTGPEGGAAVEHRELGARAALVAPRGRLRRAAAERAAEDAVGLASELGACWTVPLAISFTGGRDSRVSAAAAIAAGVDATYNTGDQVPGELDVVKELIAAAPSEMPHTVNRPEAEPEAESADALPERVAAIHLMHDGMRNPQEIRRPTVLPHAEVLPPTLSGHGGELGHGFYYANAAKLRKLRRGDDALMDQLERNARRKHSAATQPAYEAYLAECAATLDLGRETGLRGPALLDWFYLAQRLPYRSGLGARSARWSACVTPGFIRAAFDLSPRDRLRAKLHRRVLAQLVPQWRRIGFFSGGSEAMPEIKRLRIWEREREAAGVEEMLASGGVWDEVFRVDRLRQMWSEVRGGGGSADYEHVFDRVVWQVGFADHLDLLRDRATSR